MRVIFRYQKTFFHIIHLSLHLSPQGSEEQVEYHQLRNGRSWRSTSGSVWMVWIFLNQKIYYKVEYKLRITTSNANTDSHTLNLSKLLHIKSAANFYSTAGRSKFITFNMIYILCYCCGFYCDLSQGGQIIFQTIFWSKAGK